jgi:hypothetical protein
MPKSINLNNLAELIGELNASDMLEGETMTLLPFRLMTDGNHISITFIEQNIWDNEDNRGDDDRDINDVKKHIKHEMECLLGPIKQINLDKLLGTDELTEKAQAVMKEIQEEADKENEKPRSGGLRK